MYLNVNLYYVSKVWRCVKIHLKSIAQRWIKIIKMRDLYYIRYLTGINIFSLFHYRESWIIIDCAIFMIKSAIWRFARVKISKELGDEEAEEKRGSGETLNVTWDSPFWTHIILFGIYKRFYYSLVFGVQLIIHCEREQKTGTVRTLLGYQKRQKWISRFLLDSSPFNGRSRLFVAACRRLFPVYTYTWFSPFHTHCVK